MDELRECPFCGGRAIVRERFIHGTANKKHYRLECAGCHASFLNWYKNADKAIAAWNRRADHLPDATKMVSNADRIRGMTDEELAEYIFDLGNGPEYCYGHCAYQNDDDLCKTHSSRGLKQEGCIHGVIDWLRQPCGGVEND